MHNLEPTSPSEAVQLYIQERRPEVSQATLYEHRTRLRRFTEWCEKQDIDNMNDMTRQVAYRYRVYRTDEVAPTTLENEIRTFRLFIRFCERFGCVSDGVARNIKVPTAPKGDRSRTVKLDPERAEAILDYLERFEYASFRHVLFYLMWNLGARIGGIRTLDLGDYYEQSVDGPYLDFVHRPETGTPLKNGWKSERKPPISDHLAKILNDYISTHRHDVSDENGRQPLLTTPQGRPAKTTIQRNIYGLTRPCMITGECPHGRDVSTCEATGDYNEASKCPDSRSPHALRRGRATKNLNDGMPEEMVSDRMDMSPEVLREHYNEQTSRDKRRLQREFLNGR